MLYHIKSAGFPILRSFEVVYPIPDLTTPTPSCVSAFRFRHGLRCAFPQPTVLTIRGTRVSTTTASHMSSLVSSSAICVPFGMQMDWSHFGATLGLARSLSCLVLDAISFGELPIDFIAAVPMPQVLTLDLRFQSLKLMALAIRRLNLPQLTTLIFRCSGQTDLACMLICSVFLVQVEDFQLVTDRRCRVSHKFRHLYEFLHRTKRLDLRRASTAAFQAFVLATTPPSAGQGSYCGACPALVELRLRNVTLTEVKRLVERRREVVYCELEELTVYTPGHMALLAEREWLNAQAFVFMLHTV
jgi:hypothetical protein